jgi:hypothetical protein
VPSPATLERLMKAVITSQKREKRIETSIEVVLGKFGVRPPELKPVVKYNMNSDSDPDIKE